MIMIMITIMIMIMMMIIIIMITITIIINNYVCLSMCSASYGGRVGFWGSKATLRGEPIGQRSSRDQ